MNVETAGVAFAEKIMVLAYAAETVAAAVEEWSSSSKQEEVLHLGEGSNSCYKIPLECVALTQEIVEWLELVKDSSRAGE